MNFVSDPRVIQLGVLDTAMADDKRGRDKKARDAERRQRERAIAEELERSDETEPPVDAAELTDFETELDSLDFPATGTEILAAVGDREIDSVDGTYTITELVPDTDEETFDAPSSVRARIQRPTVAAAMKRVVEASEMLTNGGLGESQRNAYEKTFEKLEGLEGDDDRGIQAISDWIVGQIRDKGKPPGSRAVRRQAATFCRANGYQVRSDEWLGI